VVIFALLLEHLQDLFFGNLHRVPFIERWFAEWC
jgi:hypothetical protein